MIDEQKSSGEQFQRLKKRRDAFIALGLGLGLVGFIIMLDKSGSDSIAADDRAVAASASAPDHEDEGVTTIYVNFVVNSGLAFDNVQAQTGFSETQIKERIRRCMRYNMSLIDRPGPLQNGVDCRNVRVDMAIFRDRPSQPAPVALQSRSEGAGASSPATPEPSPIGISRGLPTPQERTVRDAPVETLTPIRDRAVDAIKRFEAGRNLTEDQLAALTGKTEDALERRVGSCYAMNRNCDGQGEIQSAIDSWEVSKAQMEAARRDQREAEAAASSPN